MDTLHVDGKVNRLSDENFKRPRQTTKSFSPMKAKVVAFNSSENFVHPHVLSLLRMIMLLLYEFLCFIVIFLFLKSIRRIMFLLI
ncbi:hypothetical protein HanRHA438_Chr16g0746671 [Helianthus annuus]|nr:hypothetical protein HanRHA438_Chr16g0746671 [Helianthus annuus]